MTSLSAVAERSAAGAGTDLGQFQQSFFDEAADNLASFEQVLLGLDPAAPADEALHAVFRCAHSVKGGAAIFGFTEVTALTHAMETLLDRLRRHETAVRSEIIDTLLQAGDLLRAMLAWHRQPEGELPQAGALLERLKAHAAPAAAGGLPGAGGERDLELLAGPLQPPSLADDLLELFREVGGAGTLERAEAPAGLAAGRVRFRLRTTASDDEVLDLCSFHVAREQIALAPWSDAPAAQAPAAAPALPAAAAGVAAPAGTPAPRGASLASETLRVSVEKIDALINLMGELVIHQAMLSQRVARLDASTRQQLDVGLADVDRTTRHLQESVMAIRMIPMSEVFQRFPRMLRDLAGRLGKQVALRTVGGATELDKGMIEKITDPLTHLVRNSVDHGFELPQERLAAGKPAEGTLTLSARHEGGCIVIEVRDDGRGLDRERILAKARRNGMALPENISDPEVWQLIFAPGFSTAEVVTEISGRGVGMDVVRRNILGLGGSVDLQSQTGRGTCVSVRLPLTLAIMDGITVAAGGEQYVLPLASVLESFQVAPGVIRCMPGGLRVVPVREDYVPVLGLDAFVGRPLPRSGGPTMLVLVQSEGRRVALEVGEIVGQQQVVVKNLEQHYGRVPGISAATIMGDGSVALILDVAALVQGAQAAPAGAGVASAPSSPGAPPAPSSPGSGGRKNRGTRKKGAAAAAPSAAA